MKKWKNSDRHWWFLDVHFHNSKYILSIKTYQSNKNLSKWAKAVVYWSLHESALENSDHWNTAEKAIINGWTSPRDHIKIAWNKKIGLRSVNYQISEPGYVKTTSIAE